MQKYYFKMVVTEHFQSESREKFVMLHCMSYVLHKSPAIRETFVIYFTFVSFLTRRNGFRRV
jgi:hypothetical protein